MSEQTSTTLEFSIGEKVKLAKKMEGSKEKPLVYGDPTNNCNRIKTSLPQNTEVVIKLGQRPALPRSSTGGAGATPGPDKYYSCQKLDGLKYRLVKDTTDGMNDPRYRVPHTSLSLSGDGKQLNRVFVEGEYAHVTKEWNWETKDGKQSLKTSATYNFYRTDTSEQHPIYWKSDALHPASAYKKL
ncbi:hypothetical protein CPB84DRAFT_569195 [Gymnopilus junonius]|uniref:Uncharacterized protein n=1 Tax=Gymnopilus junonius TaxID=109634 RepID=A0A9P5NVT7_GYMJU|nr:hypothetical protein CPB84DRAFT_569195 [Gymnopilus junonius]